jgi:flagellar biosynthesis component FlhA
MAATTSATDEPIAHVVDGLEAVLRRNLDQFVALDDVLALVDEDDAAARLDPSARLRMAAITRALARDRVPLTAVALMVEHANAEGTAQDAIERVRLAMWDRLPGNDPGHRRVPLPESLATEVDAVFDLERGRLAATASPLEAEAVEQKLAEWVAKTEPATLAVVVDRENQRRVIQRLVRRYHPDVPVLVRAGTREAMELTEQPQPSEELHA